MPHPDTTSPFLLDCSSLDLDHLAIFYSPELLNFGFGFEAAIL